MCQKKAKNKINLQQCISLHITLPQIIRLQNDPQAIKIMFPAAQNDLAKNAREKPKPKQTCNSAFHYILPCHKLYLYKTTHKHSKLCSQLLKMAKPKMPEKAKNKTNLQQCISLVQFTTYYPSTNYTFTKRH